MSDATGQRRLFGSIEGGGTKFVCAVASGPEHIVARSVVATRDPSATLAEVAAFFRSAPVVAAFGMGSFGPLVLNRTDPRYGHIGPTTKPGWTDVDILAPLREFGKPLGLETDVGAALIGEARHGAASGLSEACYVTVGTGVGGAAMTAGHVVPGHPHAEFGHFYPKRHPLDTFDGTCPFHGDCIEGLTSGPAIEARWGRSLAQLPEDHPAHVIAAWYIGQVCVAIMGFFAPQAIILGGGVMNCPGLLARVGRAADALSHDYYGGPISDRLHPPRLGADAGIIGALILAAEAWEAAANPTG